MLSKWYAHRDLQRLIIPREQYRPFPTVAERCAWEILPESLQTGLLRSATKYLGWQWPALPATLFMEFRRCGDRKLYEKPHFARRQALEALTVAECVEDQGRYLDDIINGVWCICEESFWGVPAHVYSREPLPDSAESSIDLFAAETAALLAWALYLLQPRLDAVSPLIGERIRRETKTRILDPFLNRDDFWWMGLSEPARRLNNWTPWCVSNCLSVALLLEEDPERRIRAIAKALRILDAFLTPYPEDGGCDEGTSYWSRAGGSLFDCLELLYTASGGEVCVYHNPLIQDIGRYLYRSFISGNYFVNFADGGAVVNIAADLVYRYGRRIDDPLLRALGSSAHHARRERRSLLHGPLLRLLPAIFNFSDIEKASTRPQFVRDAWLPHIQFMTARDTCSDKGLYLAAKGGHNAESHNHNDVGQFVVYASGRPILIDVGVGTYTAKTFSSRRYEIWTMQSAFHNLPTVNGVQQQAGEAFRARAVSYHSDDICAELRLDISSAYPKAAGIEHWQRRLRLERRPSPAIHIVDEFALSTVSADIVLSLMTPQEPQMVGADAILLDEGRAVLAFRGEGLSSRIERISVDDEHLRATWGDYLYRVLLQPDRAVQRGLWELRLTEV